jgi:hypothetical protein
VDPATGRRELVIDYASDADALPMEHEEEHRALANKLLDGGLRGGTVSVTRATEAPATEGSAETAAAAEPTATKR